MSQPAFPDLAPLLRVEQVLLPVYQYALTLTLEESRSLRDLELAALKLACAGVTRLPRMAELLGLPDTRALVPALTELVQHEAIALGEGDEIQITPTGDRMVQRDQTKSYRHVRVNVRYDPYANTFTWGDADDDDTLAHKEALATNLRIMPSPSHLAPATVEDRREDIQSLVNEHGLPEDEHGTVRPRHRLVVGMRASTPETIYLPAEFRVMQIDPSGARITLSRDGKIDELAGEYLTTIGVQGANSALPMSLPWPEPHDRLARDLLAAARLVSTTALRLELPDTTAVEERLGGIVNGASRKLVLVHHFLYQGEADEDLAEQIRAMLRQHDDLRVLLLVPDPFPLPDQEQAVDRLLTEITDTAPTRVRKERIVGAIATVAVADDTRSYFTVPNFLPLAGNRGLRFEQAYQGADTHAATTLQTPFTASS